ncbi:hypothetical protein GDO86_001708 [Hymenochirus boettgeri]|uniref:Selenoprotein M n=1 Tax=Hymenochirus boettgeri TaxID=247094 RepID=A0A8T2KFR5_9PIPI|nr:hypothetical protein GDO86_001708 [Hymenochirus boettgeri]
MWPLLLLLGLAHPLLGYQIDWKKLETIARGKIELNRLKEVKDFVTDELPLFHNLEMKQIPGADPELVLLSSKNKELERIPLREMTRKQINKLVKDLGFYKKKSRTAQVPPEFQMAPARNTGGNREDL